MLNIKPIMLLAGDHPNTAETGSGCIMNVISYLNGEAQITDRSPCVDPVVRKLMMAINDSLNGPDRQRLIPFVQRAMGTAGADRRTTENRLIVMCGAVSTMMAAIPAYAGFKSSILEDRVKSALMVAQHHFVQGSLDDSATCLSAALAALLGGIYFSEAASYGGRPSALCDHWIRTGDLATGATSAHVAVHFQAVNLGEHLINIVLKHVDAMLPPADEVSAEVIRRAEDLVAAHNKHRAHALA